MHHLNEYRVKKINTPVNLNNFEGRTGGYQTYECHSRLLWRAPTSKFSVTYCETHPASKQGFLEHINSIIPDSEEYIMSNVLKDNNVTNNILLLIFKQ